MECEEGTDTGGYGLDHIPNVNGGPRPNVNAVL